MLRETPIATRLDRDGEDAAGSQRRDARRVGSPSFGRNDAIHETQAHDVAMPGSGDGGAGRPERTWAPLAASAAPLTPP